jgi:capsular exopolysaccharide synthesis family protein
VTLREVLRALRKNWWIVLGVTVVTTVLSAVLAVSATPIYEGSVTFFARTPPTVESDPLQGDQFGQQRVNTYVKLLGSERLAENIRDETDLDLAVSDLMKTIDGTADLNTVLLTATVRDSSPTRVETILESLSEAFPSLVRDIESDGTTQQAPVELEVVSGPLIKPFPVSPVKRVWVAVGLLLGLVLGTSLGLLRALLDRSVRTDEALQDSSGIPVLGWIPLDRTARKRRHIVEQDSGPTLEAFRKLRTNLQFVDIDAPVGVFVVTSAVAGEGKSTTATYLAISFARAGKRVLLVEADLRRPGIARSLHLEGSVGLTNLLVGQAELRELVQPWGRFDLHVLASGPIPPNPAELIGSQHMADFVKQARLAYDCVIIDTAPLLPVTDGAVAAAQADGTLFVVRYGRTKKAEVRRAVELLRAVDARVLGAVLSSIPRRGGDDYSYRTYDYEGPGRQGAAVAWPPETGIKSEAHRHRAG